MTPPRRKEPNFPSFSRGSSMIMLFMITAPATNPKRITTAGFGTSATAPTAQPSREAAACFANPGRFLFAEKCA